MKYLVILTLLLFSMSYIQAQIKSLQDFQWENRLLIIYAKNVDSQTLNSQLNQIKKQKNEFEERALKVIVLRNEKVEIWSSNQPQKLDYNQIMKDLNIEIEKEYQNLLIGKDGGVKLKNNSPISNIKIFNTIDAMPMRQREMRGGN